MLAAEAVEVSDRGAGRSPPLMLLAQLGASSSAAAAAAASAPMGPTADVSAVSGLQGHRRVSVPGCAEAEGGCALERTSLVASMAGKVLLGSSWSASRAEGSVRDGSGDSGTLLLTEVPCLNALVTSLSQPGSRTGL